MWRPPLQEKSAPVVKPESSPASQAQIEPISSGVPRRLTGIVDDDLLEDLGLDGLDHLGADVARAHRVDGDALGCHLLRQRHREAVHAGLGRRVVGLARLALLAVDRRDLDDAAPAFFDHARHHLLGDVEHAGQVGVDHRVPVFARHLHEHAVARDAGVVDQHVDRAVLADGLGEGLHGGIPVGDVAHRRVEGVAERLLLVDPLDEVARRTAAGDDLEAVLVQALADGGADAAHAAGDVRHFLCHCSLLDIRWLFSLIRDRGSGQAGSP